MGRADQITTFLKQHDYKLYCDKNKEGTLCVYREGQTSEYYQLGDNVLVNVRPAPHFIFALTDTWQTTGKPVEWGYMPIMERLKKLDSWNRQVAEDLIEQYEKDEASKERDRDNENEAFLKDFRRQFAKSTDGINTASLKKIG